MFLQPQQDAFPDIQTNINFMRQNHQQTFENSHFQGNVKTNEWRFL